MALSRKTEHGRPDSSHWLMKDGHVLASLETAESRLARIKGLLGKSDFSGAYLLPRTKSIHTLGMRFGLDVAFLDDGNTVMKVISLPPNRISGYHVHAASVLEARAGAFERWGIAVGDVLEVSEECE